MSVQKFTARGRTIYRVRWREAGRHRGRDFDRKRDADAFDAEVRRRKQLGTLAELDAGAITLTEYATGTWASAHAAALAPKTRRTYAWAYDKHLAPRIGALPLRDISPDTVARLQADLLQAGAGPEGTRKAITLLGGIL